MRATPGTEIDAPRQRLTVEELREAAVSSNTADAYKSAIRHYQITCGRLLPAQPDEICQYLADHAHLLSVRTLEVRLAALSKWHQVQGLPDPTRTVDVKHVMKGVRKKFMSPPKKAKPFKIEVIRKIVAHLDAEALQALCEIQHGESRETVQYRKARRRQLKALRDKALLLVGFWRAFRSDELSRLVVQNITAVRGQDIEIYLTHSKTDRAAKGKSYHMDALRELCPVSAYLDWIEESGICEGPVFRKIHHWGAVAEDGIASKSIGPVLRDMCESAGIDSESISTHSMRHGFANWAAKENWSLPSIMSFVGWASHRNAAGYIRDNHDFGSLSLNSPADRIEGSHSSTVGQTYLAIPER